MNKQQFLSALRRALSGLPDAECDNVMQYYEDYFLDAEGESEEEIICGLGNPQKIADDILREYRELQPHANPQVRRPRRAGGRASTLGCSQCSSCLQFRLASRSQAVCSPPRQEFCWQASQPSAPY